jgi:hypothetical protein
VRQRSRAPSQRGGNFTPWRAHAARRHTQSDHPGRSNASICGLSAVQVDTERYTPARSEVVQVRRRTNVWLFPALLLATACASVISFEPPPPGTDAGPHGTAGAPSGGDPGSGGTTGIDGAGGDPSMAQSGGTPAVATGGMMSAGGNTSSSTGSTSTGGSQFIQPIGLGGGTSSGNGGRRGGTGNTGSGSCSLTSCPACNVAQGPACCTPAGKCGCPLFWIPGTCG